MISKRDSKISDIYSESSSMYREQENWKAVDLGKPKGKHQLLNSDETLLCTDSQKVEISQKVKI